MLSRVIVRTKQIYLEQGLLAFWKVIPGVIALTWLMWANLSQESLSAMAQSTLSSLLGIVGAIFANLSGAGGGVVFIPVFSQLGFSEAQSLSTSFSIQCFGMTAGAITWSLHYRQHHYADQQWSPLFNIVVMTALFSVLGIWSVYGGLVDAPASLAHSFSLFSIVLGLSLLAQIYLIKAKPEPRTRLSTFDYGALLLIGYFGGLITAWLSVGVGEILVLYLIFRGFNIALSIAAAVVVTAITVWSAAPEHLWLNSATVWDVAMYAGPGAIIGGILAKTLAGMISTKALKTVLGLWILMMGVVG
ncbi:sulfite exporter TauE/SafE family protein [Psychrobium sp. 1_MG-2023]|uniref:sulfite exporter TauE/SafE family protein n=1 Tax=Psychrobium sp. 1_MG-2023 TaxID=3062624 RepID=UPI000C342EE0|nr:sulfite exporter TauE/SafE family protein [Psychrobium sp. 1_MG-2023]MDP2560444.1 sulfite exporter TauE/SafE family protein [Psychrobium sp. 1_MG-2023]PKF57896.1 sulfite exporter TauE/SafE family protein [Alteromonadales bacterium alter-6D02]